MSFILSAVSSCLYSQFKPLPQPLPPTAYPKIQAELRSHKIDPKYYEDEYLLAALYTLETSPSSLTLDDFQRVLWPFAKELLSNPFMVALLDKAKSAGKGLMGKLEMLWLVAEHNQRQSDDPTWTEFCEVEFLASSMADRDPQVGWYLRLPSRKQAEWKIDWSGCKNGCFVWVLRSIQDPTQAIIICRGTALRYKSIQGLHSAINDILPQMGAWGFSSLWPELKDWLLEQNILSAEVMGKSLGGTNAQMITAALTHETPIQIKALHTLQGAGSDRTVHDVFERALGQIPHQLQMNITRWNVNLSVTPVDLVPFLGGYHLGQSPSSSRPTGLHVRNVYIGEAGCHLRISQGFFKQILQLIRGLAHTHCLQVRFLSARPKIHIELLSAENTAGPIHPVIEPLRQMAVKLVRFSRPLFRHCLNKRFEHALRRHSAPI